MWHCHTDSWKVFKPNDSLAQHLFKYLHSEAVSISIFLPFQLNSQLNNYLLWIIICSYSGSQISNAMKALCEAMTEERNVVSEGFYDARIRKDCASTVRGCSGVHLMWMNICDFYSNSLSSVLDLIPKESTSLILFPHHQPCINNRLNRFSSAWFFSFLWFQPF